MIRTFHNIGQGAFYTELFDSKKIVYDCGSSTNKSIIINEIDSVFNAEDEIEIVFISHLHEDHINGLEHLLNRCTVKYLVLPFLSGIDQKIILINNLVTGNTDSFMNTMISSPEDVVGETIIRRVDVVDDNLQEVLDITNIENSGPNISSGGPIRIEDDWIYVPFNFREDDRTQIFLDELNNLGVDYENSTPNELFQNHFDKLMESYKKVPGDFNTNSMVVYSGPNSDDSGLLSNSFTHFSGRYYHPFWHYISLPGCLYFGDYCAKGTHKWNHFKRKLSSYFNRVGTIQVPHHGSKHNFNNDLIDIAEIFIISAGNNNTYYHPHKSVMHGFIKKGVLPFLVTENNLTCFYQQIE